ncbi:MAG: cytochrome c oxidase subunit II [Owenweeksia sp.]
METLLFIIVGILGLIAIAQAVRVFELSADVRGESAETENVTDKDNRNQGMLLLIFMILLLGGFIAMVIGYNKVLLPVSASEHGVNIDNLWDISMWLIIVVFFITQPILFYFGYKFSGRKDRKAVYMEHNNRLEFIWTIVPAVVLAGLIIYGLSTWSNIMNPVIDEDNDPMVVEIYAKQFSWTARYSGEDNQLGYANVRMIGGTNSLGVDPDDAKSLDDVVTTELHLPVNKPVLFKFRSQDVIHSAYLPHFRVQMNCVPGTKTQFMFKPTMTTEEMRMDPDMQEKVARINDLRGERGEDTWQFDYVLLCNKICGSAHYNMQMKIVVETEEEYNKWMSEQKSFAELL